MIFLLPLFFFGCRKETAMTGAFIDVSDEELTVDYKAGKAEMNIRWANSEWELETEKDGFLTDFTFLKGGNLTHSGTTKIQFTYIENNTGEERRQQIVFKNKTAGTDYKVNVVQASKTPLVFTINTTYTHQPVQGFGGMFNQALWFGEEYLLNSTELTKMYGPGGLGYNIIHVVINPDKARWETDMAGLKQLYNYGAIVFASGEYHKDLSEQITIDGQQVNRLLPSNYQAYTDHLLAYIDLLESHGIQLYSLSIQNEPDMKPTFYWPIEDLVTYVKEYSDQIRSRGIKVMAAEALGYQSSYTDPFLTDPEAFDKIDMLAGHYYQGFIDTADNNYVGDRHDYISSLFNNHLKGANKTWWMTEHLFNEGENETDPSKWEFHKWSYNLSHLGRELHMSMEADCSGYIWFYLKRFYGLIGDPDPRTMAPEGEVTNHGYLMSHYAKYATDRTRVTIEKPEGYPQLLVTAYEGDDDITFVILNMSEQAVPTVQFKVDKNIATASAEESTEDSKMLNKEINLLSDNQTIAVDFKPQSIVSVKLVKE